jgi:hypothetical protein
MFGPWLYYTYVVYIYTHTYIVKRCDCISV